MTFTRNGRGALLMEEDEEEICNVLPDSYNVLLLGIMRTTFVEFLVEEG